MLVLSRKIGERVVINNGAIEIKVLKIRRRYRSIRIFGTTTYGY